MLSSPVGVIRKKPSMMIEQITSITRSDCEGATDPTFVSSSNRPPSSSTRTWISEVSPTAAVAEAGVMVTSPSIRP